MDSELIGRLTRVTSGKWKDLEGRVISVGYTPGCGSTDSYFEALIMTENGSLDTFPTSMLQVLPPP